MSAWRLSVKRLKILTLGLLLGLGLSLSTVLLQTTVSAETSFEQGLAAYQAGEYQAAIAHWQTALESPSSAEQEAQIWGNLAIAYYETGQYRQALTANQTAIAQFTDLKQPAAVGQVQSNLGNVYEALGDYERAIALYEASLATARTYGNRQAAGVSLGNLGYLYFLQGGREEALTAYRQSLAIAAETGDLEGAGHRHLNLGVAHHAVNELALAAAQYRQALQIAEAIQQPTLQAKALSSLGMVAADRGDYDTAIALYETSLAISEPLQNPELQARTLNNWGHTLLAANRLDEAEQRLLAAIAHMEGVRTDLGDRHNVSLFDTQIYTYNLLTQILVAKGEPEAALEVAEAGRARAFSRLLQQRFGADAPPSLGGDVPLAIAEMQQLARDTQTTLVEYALVPEEAFRVVGRQRGRTEAIHIWVIQPDGRVTFRPRPITPTEPQLNDLIQQGRNALGIGERGVGVVASPDAATSNADFQALYQLLIAPIQDLLPTDPAAEVVLVPQESLFLVPFPALIDDRGDYLIQHHTVLTAPALQVLALQQRLSETATRSPAATASALVVGNPAMPTVWEPQLEKMEPLAPLPGAEQEAAQIARLLNTTALTGTAASEMVVKTQMATARVIHLATHGLLAYGHPQQSGIADVPGAIALAPQGPEDGLLTAAEILEELSMPAELVVLSACDTGRGDITGDGVNGLSRAFLAAGATNLVVSLWSVPDAPTAQLMISFYEDWARGVPKAQALRQAMLTTLADHPHPRNWAAFTLIGQPSAT